MTGLICSVEFECLEILKRLSRKRRVEAGGLAFHRGLLHGRELTLLASGVGKANAAHAATLLIERFAPGLVINFGIGGAYPGSGLDLCDIAIAEREIYGDEGVVTRRGFRGMRFMGMPLGSGSRVQCSGVEGKRESLKDYAEYFYNEIQLNRELVEKAISIIKESFIDFRTGPFVTLSTVTGTRQRAEELRRRYRAICENMEGAAVAHVCALYGVPFLEVRGISNIVENRDRRRWRSREAAAECQRAVMEIVKGEVRGLCR